MNEKNYLGIDLGGTNIRGGIVTNCLLNNIHSERINSLGAIDEVLQQLFLFTDKIITKSTTAIGIGVPGLVNSEEKIIYDVVNIPSWKEVPLQKLVEERYQLPVSIENDANCFALGEYYFGKGKGCTSMIGLTIGTGLGSGIIINKNLYAGKNGGAGEFGMVDYLDKCYEYYGSGQFFKNVYDVDGETVFENAKNGDKAALKMYEEMGTHLGNFVKMLLYALDIELIVIGGSVKHAWTFFNKTMCDSIETITFKRALKHLKIEVSELQNAAILGAAALCYSPL